jgi:hypothetical protein
MANIWPVYDGRHPTSGEPWADIPATEAITLFELEPNNFLSDLEVIPHFGDKGRDLTFAGFKHVVVEIKKGSVESKVEGRFLPVPSVAKERF